MARSLNWERANAREKVGPPVLRPRRAKGPSNEQRHYLKVLAKKAGVKREAA